MLLYLKDLCLDLLFNDLRLLILQIVLHPNGRRSLLNICLRIVQRWICFLTALIVRVRNAPHWVRNSLLDVTAFLGIVAELATGNLRSCA